MPPGVIWLPNAGHARIDPPKLTYLFASGKATVRSSRSQRETRSSAYNRRGSFA
jgi:hypothetical protein